MTYYLLHAGQPSAKRLLRRVADLQEASNNDIKADDVVVRWGQTGGEDPPIGRILNPHQAVSRVQSRTSMAQFLRKMGLRVLTKAQLKGQNASTFVRQYRFPVFDHQALACFRSESGPAWMNQRIQRVQDNFREVSLEDDKITMRAMYTAVRALHALGLDHGLVSMAQAQRGVLYVVDVTPSPVLKGRMLELFARGVQDMMQRDAVQSRQGPVQLGLDVELMLRNRAGKMVLASKYFGRKGKIGCDNRSVQFDGKRLPLLELRPDPAPNPLSLASNLKELMVEASETINREVVEWRAGSMPFRPFCIGGHIHFSGVPFSSHMVRVLDNYIGLPLMLVEDPKTAALRRKRYGFYGDVRHKDYGGFEYRTPASFIASRDVTVAALCVAYVVALHHRELPVFDIYDKPLQTAFFSGNKDVLAPVAERNFALLAQTAAYQRVREHIEPLLFMIRSGATWNEDQDVRVEWEVPLRKPQRTRRRRRASS